MPIDPVSEWVLTRAGELALECGFRLLPNNSRRVDETYTAMLQDAVLEIERAFRRHLAEHEARDPGYAEKVRAAIDDREARALFYRLGIEAAHATTAKRMRLLAHALAGLYTPDVDAEMRSRVSRAVVELEPSSGPRRSGAGSPNHPSRGQGRDRRGYRRRGGLDRSGRRPGDAAPERPAVACGCGLHAPGAVRSASARSGSGDDDAAREVAPAINSLLATEHQPRSLARAARRPLTSGMCRRR